MKKIVSFITMIAMLAVSAPAIAGGGHRDYRWGNDHNRHSPYYGQSYRNHGHYDRHHRRGRISTGEAIAIIGGLGILGAIINSNNNRNQTVVVERNREVCEDIVRYDRYGNPYVAGRQCWYEQ